MTRSDRSVRCVSRCLVMLMLVTCIEAGTAQAQQAKAQGAELAAVANSGADALPDAPDSQKDQRDPAEKQTSPQQQNNSQDVKPLGTAAAPYTRPTGVTGSRPAGAVIAPAKQRRIRTILISVAVIAAAGIAVGTVAALSHGSPSRP